METKPHTQLLPIRTVGQTQTVSSLDIAHGLGVQHKNLLETIKAHRQAVESDFGLIAFETRKIISDTGKGRPEKTAHLTEDQALFVGTLSRNSARVVAFKATLVRSFAEARRQLRNAAGHWLPTEQMLRQEQRISQLEQQLGQLLNLQQQAARSLLEVPRSAEAVPVETTRTKVQRLVNAYSRAKSLPQQDVWRIVYDRLYYAYRISIRQHKKRTERESWLDVAERSGYLDKIYAIVSQDLTT
jgi:Rha family phage regulatory protein